MEKYFEENRFNLRKLKRETSWQFTCQCLLSEFDVFCVVVSWLVAIPLAISKLILEFVLDLRNLKDEPNAHVEESDSEDEEPKSREGTDLLEMETETPEQNLISPQELKDLPTRIANLEGRLNLLEINALKDKKNSETKTKYVNSKDFAVGKDVTVAALFKEAKLKKNANDSAQSTSSSMISNVISQEIKKNLKRSKSIEDEGTEQNPSKQQRSAISSPNKTTPQGTQKEPITSQKTKKNLGRFKSIEDEGTEQNPSKEQRSNISSRYKTTPQQTKKEGRVKPPWQP